MRVISETVQHAVYNGTAENTRNNVVDSWLPPVSLGIYAFNPGGGSSGGGSSEPVIPGYDRVVSTPTIYVPSTAVIGPHDRMTVRGEVFEVDGDALDFRNPYDESMDGLAVALKKVDG